MRRGFHGLSAQVQTVLEQQPLSGHVFVFRGRRGDIVKVRLWTELLLGFTSDRQRIEGVLQMFQGAVLAYLITGNAEPGRLALERLAIL